MKKTREGGQALVEYAMILGLIAVVAIVALSIMGSTVSNEFTTITTAISADMTTETNSSLTTYIISQSDGPNGHTITYGSR
jgi:Flp pilus assembly pilin Flp